MGSYTSVHHCRSWLFCVWCWLAKSACFFFLLFSGCFVFVSHSHSSFFLDLSSFLVVSFIYFPVAPLTPSSSSFYSFSWEITQNSRTKMTVTAEVDGFPALFSHIPLSLLWNDSSTHLLLFELRRINSVEIRCSVVGQNVPWAERPPWKLSQVAGCSTGEAITFPVVQLPPLALCTHAVSQPTRTQSCCNQENTFVWSHPAPGFGFFHPSLHFSFPTHSPLKQARLLMVPLFDSGKEDEKNAPQQVIWVGRENPLSWPWLWFGFLAA